MGNDEIYAKVIKHMTPEQIQDNLENNEDLTEEERAALRAAFLDE